MPRASWCAVVRTALAELPCWSEKKTGLVLQLNSLSSWFFGHIMELITSTLDECTWRWPSQDAMVDVGVHVVTLVKGPAGFGKF